MKTCKAKISFYVEYRKMDNCQKRRKDCTKPQGNIGIGFLFPHSTFSPAFLFINKLDIRNDSHNYVSYLSMELHYQYGRYVWYVIGVATECASGQTECSIKYKLDKLNIFKCFRNTRSKVYRIPWRVYWDIISPFLVFL